MPRPNSTRASPEPVKNVRSTTDDGNADSRASPECESGDGVCVTPRVTLRIPRPSRRASAAALGNSGVSTRKRKQSENPPRTSDAPSTPVSTPDPASPATPTPPATHRRKRRRQPAPLSVTNVLSSPNLPTTCRKLWDWPVLSWFLGDVTQSDFDLTTDQPFQPPYATNDQPFQSATNVRSTPDTAIATVLNHRHVNPNPPLPMHYRLRWLVHDAAALIDSSPPPLPSPFVPLVSNPLKDASPACARPSPCLNATEDPNSGNGSSSRKGKRGVRRKAVTPASVRPRKRMRNVEGVPTSESNVLPSENVIPQANLPPLLPDDRVAELCAQRRIPFDDAATPTPQNDSDNREWRPGTFARPLIHHSQSPLPHECPPTRPKEDLHSRSPILTQELVCLQMVSQAQPAVLANLIYSLPRDSLVDGKDARFEHFDLYFRDMKDDQQSPLDDIDETDELANDIQELITKREVARENSRPIRAIAAEALRKAQEEQREHNELRIREVAIRERLAAISKEKAAAARAEAASTKAKNAKGRRASTRLRGAASRRRGSSNYSDPDTGAASVQVSSMAAETDDRDGFSTVAHRNASGADSGDPDALSSDEMANQSTTPHRNASDARVKENDGVAPKELFGHEETSDHDFKDGKENEGESGTVAGERVMDARIEGTQESFKGVAVRPHIDAENVCLSAIDQVPSPVSPLQAVTRIRELAMKMNTKEQ